MLKSMTGFGSAIEENAEYKVSVEIKAVNQRFLELNFHIPRQLNQWEDDLRKSIRQVAARGKLDIFINFADKRQQTAAITVNKGLLLAYQKALNNMSDVLHVARPDDVKTFVDFPEILQVDDTQELDSLKPLLFKAATKALAEFDAMRKTEGANIVKDFVMRLAKLEQQKDKIKALAPAIAENYREQLKNRLQELLAETEIDETRIIQETAMYADKVNYTEEVVRLGSHFQQFQHIIAEAAEPVGRKLDFLIQEINRETNTIGSKANNMEAARVVVDMKSEIEKLREQVQNIE